MLDGSFIDIFLYFYTVGRFVIFVSLDRAVSGFNER